MKLQSTIYNLRSLFSRPQSTIYNLRSNLGFTMIELLVVIAIIGILTTIGIGNFQTARLKARDVQRKSDLSTIAKSVEAYANDYKSYPTNDADYKIICVLPDTICDFGDPFMDINNTIYAAKLPIDPTPGNNGYLYESDGTKYTIYAALENSQDPSITVIDGKTCNSLPCNYSLKSPNQI